MLVYDTAIYVEGCHGMCRVENIDMSAVASANTAHDACGRRNIFEMRMSSVAGAKGCHLGGFPKNEVLDHL